jgi:predicted AlkP superfamily pyrophosphatase or phosphodiesterase
MTRRQWLKGMVLMSFSFAAGNEHPERWVIIVSIDGGKPSAIKRLLAEGKLPNLKQLMDDGSYTLTAQTVIPSSTAPAHVSMLTGIDYPKRFPDDEAIVKKNEPFDERRHRPVSVVTVFEIVKQAGLRTALIAGSGKRIKYVEKPGSLDVAEYLPSDDERLRRAIALLGDERKRPHLLFLHLTETDHAGHGHGWGDDGKGIPPSPEYLQALQNIDRRIGQLVAELKRQNLWAQTLLLITADHGGIDKNHGGNSPDETTIPWLAAGGLARKSSELRLQRTIRIFDTAATALAALGLPVPNDWDGKPVWQALRDGL